MTAALVLTQSRGGFLGFLAAAVVFAIGSLPVFSAPTRRLRYVVAAALAGVVVLLAVAASAAGGVDRLTSSDSSIRFHLDAWRVAAQIAVEHPVLGTGPETFPDVFPRYSHDLLPADRANALDAFRVESPHDVYLGIAAGSGIPALAAYLAVIAGFFVVAFRGLGGAARDVRLALVGALAAVAGHLVTDVFMSAEVTSTWLFWVVFGAVVGSVAQLNRQSTTFQVSPCRAGVQHRSDELGAPREEQGVLEEGDRRARRPRAPLRRGGVAPPGVAPLPPLPGGAA